MKVLMLADSLDIGGVESHVKTLASELNGKKTIGNQALDIILASNGGKTAQALTNQGLKHFSLPPPARILAVFFKLHRIIADERPNLVHAHTRRTAFLAFLPCKIYKIPLVVTAHAHFSMRFPKNLLSVWGDATIAVSHDIKENVLRSRDLRKTDIKIIQNGVNIPKNYSLDQKSSKKIVFVSRLDKDCSLGAHLLCEIATKLYKKHPDIEIFIIGGGTEKDKILQKCIEINKEAGCNFISSLGNVENTAEILSNTSLFVGVSRAALEAMACGLPVILLGNEGYLGLLNEKNLYLANKTNFTCRNCGKISSSTVLFNEILRYFELSAHKKTNLSKLSRRIAEEDHSSGKMAKETLSVYRECFSRFQSR